MALIMGMAVAAMAAVKKAEGRDRIYLTGIVVLTARMNRGLRSGEPRLAHRDRLTE